jgi:hypothetical protein
MKTPQNDGGSAFPCPVEYDANGQRASYGSEGMTLRDWFAGQALVGMLASNTKSWCAEDSYHYADAMIAAGEATK